MCVKLKYFHMALLAYNSQVYIPNKGHILGGNYLGICQETHYFIIMFTIKSKVMQLQSIIPQLMHPGKMVRVYLVIHSVLSHGVKTCLDPNMSNSKPSKKDNWANGYECSAINCNNYSSRDKHVAYHRFPADKPKERERRVSVFIVLS